MTTLEEVFLRVANGTADVAARKEIAGIAMRRQSSQSATMEQAETAKKVETEHTFSMPTRACRPSLGRLIFSSLKSTFGSRPGHVACPYLAHQSRYDHARTPRSRVCTRTKSPYRFWLIFDTLNKPEQLCTRT